jgi:hypothetical protein
METVLIVAKTVGHPSQVIAHGAGEATLVGSKLKARRKKIRPPLIAFEHPPQPFLSAGADGDKPRVAVHVRV